MHRDDHPRLRRARLRAARSFGIAALLFLVTEELLLEAHEAQEHSAHEEHIWWVDMFFFLGFLLSFLMDKLLDTD